MIRKDQQKIVVIAAAEAAPFVWTGGLGKTAGALAEGCAKAGFSVFLFLPRYKSVSITECEKITEPLTVDMGITKRTAALYKSKQMKGVTTIFVEHNELFDRRGLYASSEGAYPDNCARFSFFSHAVLAALPILGISPDLIHAHDWHCALIPLLIKTIYGSLKELKRCKSLFTIHSMDFQGVFPPTDIVWTGIGWEGYTDDNLKLGESINLLKSAIIWADAVNTQSDRYAQEIATDGNNPLSPLLAERERHSVVNGIDYQRYNPASDKLIATRFSATDMAGKTACKSALQRRAGLPLESNTALISLYTPLEYQKGVKLFADTIGPYLANHELQCIICGTGNFAITQQLEYLQKIFPQKVSFIPDDNEDLYHAVLAGSDFLMLPSYNEPYQTHTFKACCYGTIPLVTERGSLVDRMKPWNSDQKEGFCFIASDVTSESITNLTDSALNIYSSSDLPIIQRNAMHLSFPFTETIQEYSTLYNLLIKQS
ncbi:MAG: glycogen/starch synthase [Spirochaetes bacterium]|jgi:starch synthase|nr:glycogen/starch synthase [Spirochaetota bacterium]